MEKKFQAVKGRKRRAKTLGEEDRGKEGKTIQEKTKPTTFCEQC